MHIGAMGMCEHQKQLHEIKKKKDFCQVCGLLCMAAELCVWRRGFVHVGGVLCMAAGFCACVRGFVYDGGVLCMAAGHHAQNPDGASAQNPASSAQTPVTPAAHDAQNPDVSAQNPGASF